MDKISLFHGQNSPYKNFPGIQSMIFSKRTIRTTLLPKIRKIHSGVWKLQAKNSQKCQFCPKNGQILVLNDQNSAISEFSRHIEYDFLKENHKNNFNTKNQEDSQRRLEVIGQNLSKLSILPKKWPNFHCKWPKFRQIRIFQAQRV